MLKLFFRQHFLRIFPTGDYLKTLTKDLRAKICEDYLLPIFNQETKKAKAADRVGPDERIFVKKGGY
jgi:hypothetical protein